jgi:hypothetical protein
MSDFKLRSNCCLLLTTLFVHACGGQAKEAKYAADSPGDYREPHAGMHAPATPKAPRAYDASPSSRQEAEAASTHDEYAPQSFRRPGLATRWGEERESQIREVHFTRQHSQPSAVVTLSYDNERGVEAATGLDERHAYPGVFPIHGGALIVKLTDAGGDPLPSLTSAGARYVIGDEGERYQIEVENNSPGRFEIVATVDGLDVIDGQDGDFSKRGYLIDPWGSLTIEGFRDSSESVRAFRFGNLEDSYAASRGKGMNIGVIGVALFEEQGFFWPNHVRDPYPRRPDPFPGRFAPPPGG